MTQLFESIRNWNEILDFLSKKYFSTSREIRSPPDPTTKAVERHLIIFHPNHQDLFIYFSYPGKVTHEIKPQVFAVRREYLNLTTEQQNEIEQLEFQLINDISTIICYTLWARLLKKE